MQGLIDLVHKGFFPRDRGSPTPISAAPRRLNGYSYTFRNG